MGDVRRGAEAATPRADFWCPTCKEALSHSVPLRCSSCSRIYPRLGGVWCLVPNPAVWCSIWLSRVGSYAELIRQRVAELESRQGKSVPTELTSRRIERIKSALQSQLTQISAHFEVLRPGIPHTASSLIPGALQSSQVPVLKCYENLFRDWSWGDAEASQSLDLVKKLAPSSLGALAVYGAGAGRLAVDVHQALSPFCTVALDINPFPLLVAARLLEGEQVSLPEFPVGPHSAEKAVVLQTLQCAAQLAPNFSFAFGDALRPPFAPSSLDTVLTSWVVDALDADFLDIATAINQVLRVGGTWLNIGPLRFDGAVAEAYGIEEVHELVGACGFELGLQLNETVDYFKSPHSGSHRKETVFGFAARKVSEASPRHVEGAHASWLLDPELPIPLTPSGSALRRNSVITIGVLSLVDGKRSLNDVARSLAAQWHVAPETLVEPLREFFAKLPLS